jgi:hypothetical protein
VSSLATPFLEEEGSLDAGSVMGLARRLGADLREIPPAEAARLLRAGLDAFAQHGPAPWAKRDSGDYRTTLGLAVLADQRARELAAAAEGAGQATEAPSRTTADRWPPGERERLVAEFYRSPEGRALTGVVARFLPRDLVAFCADYLGRDPLRPGPFLFRRLLRDVLPMRLVLPARLAGDVAPVIRAWAAWTAERANLPKRLRRRLLPELDGELREFPAVLAPRVEGVDLEHGERVIGLGHVSTSRREWAIVPDVAGSRTAIRSQPGLSPGKVSPAGRRSPAAQLVPDVSAAGNADEPERRPLVIAV